VRNANTWDGRFYDNGVYIGHDEPMVTFLSSRAGSGNNVTWTETLSRDPVKAPTVSSPGHDVPHWFERSSAPWVSMAMCDPNAMHPGERRQRPGLHHDCDLSPEQLSGRRIGVHGGAALPAGPAAVGGQPSCDKSHWCAALTVDSAERTLNFAQCNNNYRAVQ
jgi:hypothetical protein